jgi:hypothetical protein
MSPIILNYISIMVNRRSEQRHGNVNYGTDDNEIVLYFCSVGKVNQHLRKPLVSWFEHLREYFLYYSRILESLTPRTLAA